MRVQGFNTKELNGEHTLTFNKMLEHLTDTFLWVTVLPMWLISTSPPPLLLQIAAECSPNRSERIPTKHHASIYQAFTELTAYFDELVAYKTSKLALGEKETVTVDLLGLFAPPSPLLRP